MFSGYWNFRSHHHNHLGDEETEMGRREEHEDSIYAEEEVVGHGWFKSILKARDSVVGRSYLI